MASDLRASDPRPGLRAEARRLGFDQVGFARPEALAHLGRDRALAEWLDAGYQGEMGWMAETAARRGDPRVLWPGVRSIVMVGANYGPASDPLALLDEADRGVIAAYARMRDYHDVLKGRLKMLAQHLASRLGAEVKVFVDTAPVMEKPLAQAAGIGWQGKHTNLVSRAHGSWLFLGALFTAADLAPDEAEADHCGTCRRCLDACPTGAFPAPYRLDARRCIAYLSIEYGGVIPVEFRAAMGNRVYGCDDCLAVCPWNKWAGASRDAKLSERADLAAPALAELVTLDDAGFRRRFATTPVKRIGRDRFLRNVLIAIGNSGDPAYRPLVIARLDDASPLVRAMAVWALAQLGGVGAEVHRAGTETDEAVRAEWHAALDDAVVPEAE
ncbi:tRNA epoxyqueuosine(34) reductase QueG [Zavarzinia compransoris]|uniref:Epoxyqueuosine reductase n=1 Tax=Zavarzinia compransoris TaxID=1264899 RepID=A0A317EAB8_9PROT|nr:tRNA epoxyqueuosine(34) reductase QueG [Zavarzinia compransoris]PWR22125.1 tRNA epoxyqueuosine(34) reductase QueG [Zavarzinia compransoris]TDP47127.1 epoxyqueuosine reductase [Zavarzinia compransoris]